MNAFIYCLALVGFALSVAVHASTFLGVDPQESFPPVWLLHVGIFVVWIPAILSTRRRTQGAAKARQWDALLAGAPEWMRRLVVPLFVYTFFNFFFSLVVLTGGHSPRAEKGTFVLMDHGKVVRTISEGEYHRYRAYEVRGFSGHWMLFYFAGAAMVYPRRGEGEEAASVGERGQSTSA